MNIRFCGFCSSISQDGADRCPVCGAQLMQEVAEELFNDPANPWPFQPLEQLCLRIQGQPRMIRFSGTHSVYHLWSQMHSAFESMTLYCHPRQDELELMSFPAGHRPDGWDLLEPGRLLNCAHRKFSFHTYQESDPAVALKPGEMVMEYQGSFELDDCPRKAWGNVLGWLVGTAPRPAPDWTYEI